MIQRYTCNIELLDECPHLEPLLKDKDGGYVLHSDHAAELAEWKQRAERAEASLAARIQNNKGSELVLETARDAWRTRAERAEAYVAGQDVRSDFRNAGEMRAALDDLRDTMNVLAAETRASRPVIERLERHNTLLRAECEACRSLDKVREDTFPGQPQRYAALSVVLQARAATDAAGILNGART